MIGGISNAGRRFWHPTANAGSIASTTTRSTRFINRSLRKAEPYARYRKKMQEQSKARQQMVGKNRGGCDRNRYDSAICTKMKVVAGFSLRHVLQPQGA